jgi:hypothetical protein
MKTFTALFSLAASIGALSPSAHAASGATPAAAPVPTVAWTVPSGWKKETIPFPLDFAPDVTHRGVEELRFMPGFFDPKTPGYWSYAFVWWIEDAPATDPKTMAEELARYFRGLNETVGGKKFKIDPKGFTAAFSADGATGTIRSVDGFTTGKPIALNVRARKIECPAAGRHAALFALSPQPFESPIWKQLLERIGDFKCPAPADAARP